MRRFDYRAREKETGKAVKGSIQAADERSAGKLLLDQGFIPDSIRDHDEKSLFKKSQTKVKTKDRITFTRQFATLISAGLPLSSSLKTVAEQTESKGMKAVIEEVLASVEGGKTLHESFAKRPDIFNNVYLSLIQAGEASGTLDISLNRLADQEEKDAAMISKIKGAMVYPAIILVVIIAVLVFMMVAVVPQVRDLYDDMKKELPGLTQGLVNLTNFFANFWWLILLIVGGVTAAIVFYFKSTESGKKLKDNIKLKVPIFGGLFRKLYVTRFARTTEMMLGAGVQMLESIQIAVSAPNNYIIEAEFSKAIDILKAGKPLSEALSDRQYMLPLIPQMTSIGEETGKIDEMIGRAALVYENELDAQVAAISTMIEPILMVVMAGLIGIVVGGTLLPIYSLVGSIS